MTAFAVGYWHDCGTPAASNRRALRRLLAGLGCLALAAVDYLRPMDDRAVDVERIGASGGVVVIRDVGRRFPGLLVQGDTMLSLLHDLEEAAPNSAAADTVRHWLAGYERVMATADRALPYFRGGKRDQIQA